MDIKEQLMMKPRVVILGASLAIIIATLGACTAMNKWVGLPDENPFEEAVEDFIEHETGIRIDITPDSEEKNDG